MSKILGNVAFAALVIAFGAGTVTVGWLAIPAIALVWGVIAPSNVHAGLSAAVAAGLSWGVLLGWTATQGPVGALAARVGGIFGVPAWAFFGITLLFVALLASSAALAAGALTPSRLTRKKP